MSLDASQRLCPRCQFPAASGHAFCPQCGLRLSEKPASSTAAPEVSQPLPGDTEGKPTASEFFAGPEIEAISTAWSTPPQPPNSSGLPPAESPTAPLAAMPVKRRRRLKKVLLVLAIALVIVLGTGGGLAYILTRTNPVIQVTSAYDVATTPVGAAATSFHITGQQFIANASITVLLDGQAAPGVPTISSDDHGNMQADVTVTSQWAVGNHMLAARDALGNTTREAVPIAIAVQGLDGTPGPNGAPADDDSFSISVQVTSMTASGESDNFEATLTILHNPDPAIGTICDPQFTGQPITRKGTLKNSTIPYTETILFGCQVTYKHGQLTYKEIATSDTFVVGRSLHCAPSGPYVYSEYDGSFSSNTSSKGTYFRAYSQANCTDGSYIYRESLTGTWEGSI